MITRECVNRRRMNVCFIFQLEVIEIGIYIIKNIINGDCYIGKSLNIKRRWNQHRYRYNKKGKHYNYYIYRAMRKYGLENFEFEVLEYCNKDNLIDREQYYCMLYKPKYNMIIPKQDFVYDEDVKKHHKEKCKLSWENKSEELKEKTLSNLKLGKGGRKDKVKIKAINIITLEEFEFDSLKDASEYLNIPVSSISQILNPNHKRKKSKNYTFFKI